MARKSNEQPLKDAVTDMLKAFNLEERMLQYKLIASWEKIMGPTVARRTVEIRFYEKKLFITLNSASLRQELFNERDKIRNLLNEETGAEVVTEVVFK